MAAVTHNTIVEKPTTIIVWWWHARILYRYLLFVSWITDNFKYINRMTFNLNMVFFRTTFYFWKSSNFIKILLYYTTNMVSPRDACVKNFLFRYNIPFSIIVINFWYLVSFIEANFKIDKMKISRDTDL